MSEAFFIFGRPGEIANFYETDDVVSVGPLATCGHEGRFEISFTRPEQKFSWPLIPGCVYQKDTLAIVVEIHRSHRLINGHWLGISLDATCVQIPKAELRFRSYWTPDAGNLILHGITGWAEAEASQLISIDHEHDVFDWTKIDLQTNPKPMHHPGFGHWCIRENFEKFIRQDRLGWRSDPLTAGPLTI